MNWEAIRAIVSIIFTAGKIFDIIKKHRLKKQAKKNRLAIKGRGNRPNGKNNDV